MNLGFTGLGAEIIEHEQRGEERVMQVLSRAVTRRAAIRGAKAEASALIPVRDQEVIRVLEDRKLGPFSTRYLITIGHNTDNWEMPGGRWRGDY